MRNRLIIIGFVVTGLLAATILLRISSQGTLEVTSSNGSVINLFVSPTAQARKIGVGHAKIRVTPGRYMVVASSQEQSSASAAEVTRGQTTTIQLSLKNLSSAKNVYDYTASNLIARGQNLRFVNLGQQLLYQANAGQSEATRLDPALFPVQDVQWQNYDTGVAQKTDGTLWYEQGGSSQPINVPATAVSYSLNAAGQLAIVTNDGLYIFGSPTAVGRQILKSSIGDNQVALSNRGFSLIYTDPAQTFEQASTPKSSLLDSNGRPQVWPYSGDTISAAQWSPDGQRLLLIRNNQFESYDTSSRQSTVLSFWPTDNPASTVWISNLEVAVIWQNSVWRVNTQTGVMIKIATPSLSAIHTGALGISEDRHTLYVTTDASDGAGGVGSILQISL